MRTVVFAALVAAGLLAAGPAAPQQAGAAVQTVISDQISAFRADDFAAAFDYASPGIKRLFGNADRFGRMVREGYPMVWRPAEVRFAGLEDRDGRTVQTVLVTDEAGVLHVLDYEMIETERGWEIDGVRLRQPSGLGA